MPTALVITTAGINCEQELGDAFVLAGAEVEFVHLNRLMEDPAIVDRFDLIGLPGGFSYGDAVAAGRIAAQLMRQTLYTAFVRAIDRGVPIIAPCNGFQIAVQMGLLPGADRGAWPATAPAPTATLGENATACFMDRWTRVEYPKSSCSIWTAGLSEGSVPALLPIAHGEGRFIPQSEAMLHQLETNGQIAVRYAADDNPNGSVGAVAGICDPSGLVLGLMPHPERYTRWTHHPWWTRLDPNDRNGEPPGLRMFRNAVERVAGRRTETVASGA